MSMVLRFALHQITQHPDEAPVFSARCLRPDCKWSAGPTADGEKADNECMAHTGLTGHAIFARRCETVAVVTRK